MVKPTMISDLNPTEHVWDQLKQRDYDWIPRRPAELHVTLVEEWNGSE